MTGDIEKTDDGVLVIRRIHAAYRLTVGAEADRETIERVHDFHAEKCPVARSIRGSIDITSDVEVVEE